MSKRPHFPGYPHLKPSADTSRYGRVTLTSVTPTSDGYLIGCGKTSNGIVSNLFLGRDPNYKG